MKKFQYQILQFYPDKVTGEFLNVGIVAFDSESQELVFKILRRVGAISQLFSNTNTRYLLKQLSTVQSSLTRIQALIINDKFHFNRYQHVDEITRQAFVRDDSALMFSDVRYSLDISLEHLVGYLSQRLLTLGMLDVDTDIKSDKELWTKLFKVFFDEHNISPYLIERTVQTKYSEITFEHSWQNGHLNFFESVNFDLVREDNIKNKVRRWAGQIDELRTVEEDLHLYLLTKMPEENADMMAYIKSFLTDKSSPHLKVEIVTLSDIELVTAALEKEIANHHDLA